ncbi:MAG: cytochrome [Bdellovibrionales bacterium]|nr:cytochrome [Bdellovibrionales bacterium]MBL7689094.1 cytochrome [Pseudobdellovibrionaceae bacterium]
MTHGKGSAAARQDNTQPVGRFIQGDLQAVFDTLYEMGVIDPVLKQDWAEHIDSIEKDSFSIRRAVDIVNRCGSDRTQLRTELGRLDEKTLELLAVEVAREYADFHSRAVVH